MLRYGGILFLAVTLVATPAYLLLRAELSDPDQMLPGIPVMLLAPAIGWVVPLAAMLLIIWWRNTRVRRGHGALLGASAVVLYTVAIAVYLLIVKRSAIGIGIDYVMLRLAFSLPAIILAACFTELAFWLITGPRRKGAQAGGMQRSPENIRP
jgi:hypothetical protein